MAQRKQREVLDWYGNPLPEHKIPKAQEGVKGETGADGRKYLRAWSADGKPGKRIPLEESYLVIHDDQGRVVYDYRVWPPEDAKIEPGYVGFLFEDILKGYFGESYADLKAQGCLAKSPHEKRWIETSEDGEQFWRWNVVWLDRLPISAQQQELYRQPRDLCAPPVPESHSSSPCFKTEETTEILDATGKSLFPGGLWRSKSSEASIKILEDEHGKKYWINDSGERDYELPYITVSKRTENGSAGTIYDSRCDPPLLGKA